MTSAIQLDAAQHAQAISELRLKFPSASDNVLEGLLRGQAPPLPQRPESVPSPQQQADLTQCLALANDLYSKAITAAGEISNPIAAAVAKAVALGVYGFAAIECYDNNS
jgi:hypothetical protein